MRDGVRILFIAVLAVMVVGEVLVSTVDVYDFDSDAGVDDGGNPYYQVSSTGATVFSVVQYTSDFDVPASALIFADPDYASLSVTDATSAAEHLRLELDVRNVDSVVVDADALADAVSAGRVSDHALVFLSGAFPSDVYAGESDDPIFGWFRQGGVVYWVGEQIGRYVAHPDGSVTEVDGFEDLFFGTGSILDSDGRVDAEIPNEGLGDALCMSGSDAAYGLNTSVEGCISLGFTTRDGYSSVAVAPFGNGMIGIVGGMYGDDLRDDMAQLIASGVTHSTVMVFHDSFESRGDIRGALPYAGSSEVYVFAGGVFTSYGCRHTI